MIKIIPVLFIGNYDASFSRVIMLKFCIWKSANCSSHFPQHFGWQAYATCHYFEMIHVTYTGPNEEKSLCHPALSLLFFFCARLGHFRRNWLTVSSFCRHLWQREKFCDLSILATSNSYRITHEVLFLIIPLLSLPLSFSQVHHCFPDTPNLHIWLPLTNPPCF